MNLIETSILASTDFPVAEFKEHLRLGTGFTDDGAQDGLLVTYLKAAMGVIEAKTGKILINRRFTWAANYWRRDAGAQAFPVAPVASIVKLTVYDADGGSAVIAASEYGLQKDMQRPMIFPKAGELPKIPPNGYALITFYAGYGTWSAIPGDLQQAMLMLAANYYENRDMMINARGQVPFSVSALIERYRKIRIGGAP